MGAKKAVIRAATSEVRERLADLVTDVAFRNVRVILQRHGKDIAALISVEDLERLRRVEAGLPSETSAASGPKKTRSGS
ncbi:MAG: type II toxin-antitoxin system prevent-host-death family antitoxin [Gemmatimonadota bacterium]